MAEDLVSYLKTLKAQGVPRDQARQMAEAWLAKQGGGQEQGAAADAGPVGGGQRGAGPWRDGYAGADLSRPPAASATETGAAYAAESMAPGITKFTARTGDPRQGRSLLDLLPLGGPLNPLWEPLSKSGEEGRQASAAAGEQLAQAGRDNPIAATAGTIGGSLAGVGARVGGAVGGASKAATPLARVGASALSGAAGSGTDALVRAATGEGDLGDVATNTVAGGAFGAAAQGGAELVKKGAKAIANTRGGRAATLYNRHSDSLRGVDPTDQNIGRLAEDGSTNILRGREAKFQRDVMEPHVAAKAEIAAGRGGELAPPDDVATIYDEMQRLATSDKLMPSERGTVKALMGDLVAGFDEVTGQPLFKPKTWEQVNDLRGMYDRVAQVGVPGQGVGRAEMKGVADAARDVVDAGPYAETNARFHAGAKALEEDRNLLGLNKKPRRNPSIETPEGLDEREVERVARHLRRQSENTTTAGINNGGGGNLDQFVQRNPEFQRDVELPSALSAKGDLRFRLPGQTPAHGGLLGRIGQGSTGVGLGALALQQAMDSIPPSLAPLGLGLGFLAANIDPLTGRVLMPAANQAARAARHVTPATVGTAAPAATSLAAPLLDEFTLRLGLPPLDERKRR